MALHQSFDKGPMLELTAAFQIFHGGNSTFRASLCVLRLFLMQGLCMVTVQNYLLEEYTLIALTVTTISDPYLSALVMVE